jgi:hypothetical protein
MDSCFGRSWHLKSGLRINIKLQNKLLLIGMAMVYGSESNFSIYLLAVNEYYFLSKCRYRRAQLALQKGDEDLAREALKRRKSYAVCVLDDV